MSDSEFGRIGGDLVIEFTARIAARIRPRPRPRPPPRCDGARRPRGAHLLLPRHGVAADRPRHHARQPGPAVQDGSAAPSPPELRSPIARIGNCRTRRPCQVGSVRFRRPSNTQGEHCDASQSLLADDLALSASSSRSRPRQPGSELLKDKKINEEHPEGLRAVFLGETAADKAANVQDGTDHPQLEKSTGRGAGRRPERCRQGDLPRRIEGHCDGKKAATFTYDLARACPSR